MNALIRSITFSASLLILSACSTIDKHAVKEDMHHPGATTSGLLSEARSNVIAPMESEQSAFKLLFQNSDALQWRLALIDHATSSIDLQVFIWSNDICGRVMLDRLMQAADRGVRVRLLIDDFPKGWSDDGMFIISQHSNISMRVFNPTKVRRGIISSIVERVMYFSELNRRMHNKQMLVDGNWAVLGGRNIGNPYFGLDPKYNFRDVDLLITGPVLAELESSFDIYWNSDAAFDALHLKKELSEKKQTKILDAFDSILASDRAYLEQTPFPVERSDWSSDFARLPDEMVPGVATYMQDAPVVRGDRGQRLFEQMQDFAGLGTKDTIVVSPYLIPSKAIIANISTNVANGGRVQILTASMDSNNHTMANSKYKKYRKPLLKSGASIHEFSGQPGAAMRSRSDTSPVTSKFISLHIKAFAVDKRWLYMGSLNMDPRALDINTEDILAIDSPVLTNQLIEEATRMAKPENAWAVTLNDKNKLRWEADGEVRKHQPARSFGQRCTDWFFRWMPIESQL